MKSVKIWDKHESINGVLAEDVIRFHGIREEDEIFLVTEGDMVTCVENVSTIRSIYNLNSDLTNLEVATEYLKIMNERIQKEDEAIPKAEAEQQETKLIVNNLTKELAQEKLNNIKKEKVINNLTKELTSVKLDVIQLKKGVM